MAISERKIYPRTGDTQTVYLKSVITDTSIQIGDYTMYNDFVHDPRDFQKNNVLYHYPINDNHLKIGKFCSIACGAKFLFTSANHAMRSLSTYPFLIFFEEWGLVLKLLFCLVLRLEMERLLVHGLLLQKMYRLIRLLGVSLQNK